MIGTSPTNLRSSSNSSRWVSVVPASPTLHHQFSSLVQTAKFWREARPPVVLHRFSSLLQTAKSWGDTTHRLGQDPSRPSTRGRRRQPRRRGRRRQPRRRRRRQRRRQPTDTTRGRRRGRRGRRRHPRGRCAQLSINCVLPSQNP